MLPGKRQALRRLGSPLRADPWLYLQSRRRPGSPASPERQPRRDGRSASTNVKTPTTMPSAPGRCRPQLEPPVGLHTLHRKGAAQRKACARQRGQRSQQSPASRRASERDCEHRLEIRLEELANLVVVEGEPGRPETACVCTEIEPAGADTRLELGGTI